MKTYKIVFWVSTGLLTLLMLFSAGNYFFKTEMIKGLFEGFGYPSYIVIPLGIAKVLGLIAIWLVPNESLKEWAYAGFFFEIVLAFFAHVMISDGQQMGAVIAMVLLLTSYFSRKQMLAQA
ncbi:MAG: DoxX family protein [Bacteroidota bacterium]